MAGTGGAADRDDVGADLLQRGNVFFTQAAGEGEELALLVRDVFPVAKLSRGAVVEERAAIFLKRVDEDAAEGMRAGELEDLFAGG